MNPSVVFLLAFFLRTISVSSFAEWMVNDHCSRSLVVGQVIMNEDVVESSERMIEVFRGDQKLASGSAYILGEVVVVKITNSNNEYIYEVSGGASFVDGGCQGRRMANEPEVELTLPTDSAPLAGSVKIVAGWALGRGQVKLTPPFFLTHPLGGDSTAPAAILTGATLGPAEAPIHAKLEAHDEILLRDEVPSEEEKARLRSVHKERGKYKDTKSSSSLLFDADHLSSLYNSVTQKVTSSIQPSWLKRGDSPSEYRPSKANRRQGLLGHQPDYFNFAESHNDALKGSHLRQRTARRHRKLSKIRQLFYIALIILALVAMFSLADCCMRNRFRAFKYVRHVRGHPIEDE